MSKVGLSLMGDTAGFPLLFSALLHIILIHLNPFYGRICQHTHILTCILKYLSGNKVFRAKIPTKDVLKRQILTDSIAKNYCLCRGKHVVETHFLAKYLNETHILTCILKHLDSHKVPCAKILIQNVLKRQILTDSFANI